MEWTKLRFSQSRLEHLLSKETNGEQLTCEGPYRDDFFEHFANSSAVGALHVAVGQNIGKIPDGKLDPLDLLFSTSLVQNFYHSPSFEYSYRKIAAYIDLLAYKTPNRKILEIGAGTGAATRIILRSLCSDNQDDNSPRLNQYIYTDISSTYFENAKQLFESLSTRMVYSVLDIERDPSNQGFEAEQVDLVVCVLVLHATVDLNKTLQNTRSLLKPGGKLVLFESSNPEATRVSFVFDLLPGWWSGSEEIRQQGPLLSDADWNRLLLDNGFSGAEILLPDYRDNRHTFSAIISTAVEEKKSTSVGRQTLIIIDPNVAENCDIAAQLTPTLHPVATLSRELCRSKGL